MQGLRSQKKRSLHGVNEHFFDERNAAGGHYGQTLSNRSNDRIESISSYAPFPAKLHFLLSTGQALFDKGEHLLCADSLGVNSHDCFVQAKLNTSHVSVKMQYAGRVSSAYQT